MDLFFSLLAHMRKTGATDLLLSSGTPPAFRINGRLAPRTMAAVTSEQIGQMVKAVLNEDQRRQFDQVLEYNAGRSFDNHGRFRINLFRQRGDIAMAIRSIPPEVPDIAELGLPESLREVAMQKRGLVLCVGACGSGKSTTLAALLAHRSRNDSSHIITIEDPIEYEFRHAESMINQREIGVDTHSYHEALINALRQSPDVMMIGEIRDRESLERAIEFADTGHLCLSTLHANNANQAFDRIVSFFKEEEREQILVSLAQNLRAIVSQRLLPTLQGGRVLAYEMLLYSLHVSEIIRRGEFDKLKEAMEKGASQEMISFDQCLYQLIEQGTISLDTASEYADSPGNLRLRVKLSGQERRA